MYEKPVLERFGKFRELTLIGTDEDGDGGIIFGIADGCNVLPGGVSGDAQGCRS